MIGDDLKEGSAPAEVIGCSSGGFCLCVVGGGGGGTRSIASTWKLMEHRSRISVLPTWRDCRSRENASVPERGISIPP